MSLYLSVAAAILMVIIFVGLIVTVSLAEKHDKREKQKKIEHKKQMERWLDARPMEAYRIEGYDHLARALAVGVITSEEHDEMMERVAKAVINADIQEIIEDVEIVERPELE